MKVKITSKNQVTFPRKLLQKMQVSAGDYLEVEETAEKNSVLLKPIRLRPEKLAPLHHLINPNTPEFDIQAFRSDPEAADPKYRD